MAFKLSSIYDVITSEMFESQKATIKQQKTQKAPSAVRLGRLPSGVSPTDVKRNDALIDLAYENTRWEVCMQIVLHSDQSGISRSELTSVRFAVASVMSSVRVAAEPLLPLVMQKVAKYPTFGDLYTTLAGFKLQACQLDAALKLIELAELCPHNKHALVTMKRKLMAIEGSWRANIPTKLRFYIRPANFEKVNAHIDPDIVEEAMPSINKIRADPSIAFEEWQYSLELQKWLAVANVKDGEAGLAPGTPDVPQDRPLIKMDAKVLEKIFSYLDPLSLDKMRGTCGDMNFLVSFSSCWKPIIEEILFPGFDLIAGVTFQPIMPYNILHLLISSSKRLIGASSYGPIDMDAFTSYWASNADDLVGMPESMICGATWEEWAMSSHTLMLISFLQADPSGRALEYMTERCPDIFQLYIRLLNSSDPPVVLGAVHFLMAVATSPSPSRSKWIAQLHHWRLSVHLSKFIGIRKSALAAPISALIVALEAADFIDCAHLSRLNRDSQWFQDPIDFSKEDFDGIWWIAKVDARTAGLDRTFDIICCNLAFEEAPSDIPEQLGSPIVTVKGSTVNSRGVKGTLHGDGKTSESIFGFTVENDGPKEESLFFNAVVLLHSLGGMANPSDQEPGDDPAYSFFMWRDSRPATPEFWQEATSVLVRSAEPYSHPPAWVSTSDQNLAVQSSQMRIGASAMHHSQFSSIDVLELSVLVDQVGDPSDSGGYGDILPNSLEQGDGESDAAYANRSIVFAGSHAYLYSHRLQALETFFQELVDTDMELMTKAIFEACSVLPEDVLIGVRLIVRSVPQIKDKRALLKTLKREVDAIISGAFSAQTDAWGDLESRTSYAIAASKFLDAVIGPPGSEETPIRKLYLKWSSRLGLVHPALNPADTPFSLIELLYFAQSITHEKLTEAAEMEHAGDSPEDTRGQKLFSQALNMRNEANDDSDGIVSTALVVAGAAVVSLAIGLGAFLIGRRLNRQD